MSSSSLRFIVYCLSLPLTLPSFSSSPTYTSPHPPSSFTSTLFSPRLATPTLGTSGSSASPGRRNYDAGVSCVRAVVVQELLFRCRCSGGTGDGVVPSPNPTPACAPVHPQSAITGYFNGAAAAITPPPLLSPACLRNDSVVSLRCRTQCRFRPPSAPLTLPQFPASILISSSYPHFPPLILSFHFLILFLRSSCLYFFLLSSYLS